MGRKTNALRRREQIIWALYDCLAEKGHEKVTVRDIALQAGLAPGVIHYYFKSKDEIVSGLAEAIYDRYNNLFTDSIAGTAAGQKVGQVIDFIVDNMIISRPINRVFFNLLQMAYERTELGAVVKKMFDRYRGFLEELFMEAGAGSESGRLAATLVALTEGFSVQIMVDPDAFDRETVRMLIARIIYRDLGEGSGLS